MKAIPLYFIPGAMCDERLWLPVIEYLNALAPQAYHCELLSIPKTGDLNTAVTELSQIIESKSGHSSNLNSSHNLDTRACNIIGFSLGGYLAASFAAKYPQQVKKLLLVSSMPSALSDAALKKRRRTISYIEKHGYQGVSIERTKALVDQTHHENMSVLKLIQTMDHQCGGDTLIQQLTLTLQRENVLEKLAQSQLPVSFSVGDTDCKVNIIELMHLVQNYNEMEHTVTPRTGHMFPLESPEILAQHIIKWFR